MGMAVGAQKGPRSDINITPLVDVVLVLLIIFMVLTPLMEKEIGVRVPEETPPEMLNEPPPPDLTQVVFKVDESGIWHLNTETLNDANAQERLKAYYRVAKSKEATQGPPVIFFDADDKAKYVRAVKALDVIRDSSSGWTIGMMTESIKQETAPATTPGAPGTEQQPGTTPPGATPPAGTAPSTPPK